MWSYYGSKTDQAKHYPPPKYDKIIEPFAGAAKYSLLYWDKEIVLCEKYEVVARIWKWLQKCSKDDILKLPMSMPQGSKVNDLVFDCEEQHWLYGFVVGKGAERPRNKVPDRTSVARPNHIKYNLHKIANNLYKIKHWKIIHGSYEELPNEKATWFIDPPYQNGGKSYVENKINYPELSRWCKERKGQAIVCETIEADWMDFKPMITTHGSKRKTTEAIWSNIPTAFDNKQLKIDI